MIQRYFKVAVFCTSLIFTSGVQAALIDTASSSFIDSETSLEWMDFGVNKDATYNEVVAALENGGIYTGWRLPTTEEVFTMFNNAFVGLGTQLDTGLAQRGSEAHVIDRFGTGQSALYDNLVIMGMVAHTIGLPNNAIFKGTFGLSILGSILQIIPADGTVIARADLFDNSNSSSFGALDDSRFSTLLVIDKIAVPAPAGLGIFVLGLISLSWRRKYFY